MRSDPPIETYTREVWSAVGRLWPNLGASPATIVGPQIPVLPSFLEEAHREGRTPEAAAVEVTRFFLDHYVRNVLTQDERAERLVDLHALTKRSFEESQQIGVLPFTAALFGAQQTLTEWAAVGRFRRTPAGPYTATSSARWQASRRARSPGSPYSPSRR